MSVTSERIKLLREKQGLTQAELGELINTSQRVVGNWENGNHNPSLDNLVDLCIALSTTPAFLLDFPSEDDLDPDEQELVSGYRKIDQRGQEVVKAALFHQLKYSDTMKNATGGVSRVKTEIPTDTELFVTKKSPHFQKMKEYCKTLAKQQKESGRSDLDVAKFLWTLGFSRFSAGTMLLIRNQLRIPSPLIAQLISNYLTDNYTITFPDLDVKQIISPIDG